MTYDNKHPGTAYNYYIHLLLHAEERQKHRSTHEEHSPGDDHPSLWLLHTYTETELSWRIFSLNSFIVKRITEPHETVLTRC
jgi:hypothetical protein